MKNSVAVIIPLYKNTLTLAEKFSISNTFSVLSGRDIFFLAPKNIKDWVINELICSMKLSAAKTLFLDDKYFFSIDTYSKLLTSLTFYKKFLAYKYILIAQPDALIFSDQIDIWMDRPYSYVGAPWFYGLDRPEKPLRFWGVGNGGLSLRRIDDFIRVLSRPRYIPKSSANLMPEPNEIMAKLRHLYLKHKPAWNMGPFEPPVYEDLFWGVLVPKSCSFFKVPKPEDAAYFSFETEPRYLYEFTQHILPLGCHAWEKYDYRFWNDVMRSRGITLPKND